MKYKLSPKKVNLFNSTDNLTDLNIDFETSIKVNLSDVVEKPKVINYIPKKVSKPNNSLF